MNNIFEYREVLMQATGINLSFGDNVVLRDLNLTIRNLHRPGKTQGQVVGLLGPSGIGKTQLFKILAGLNQPSSGTVRVRIAEREQPVSPGCIGVVAQSYPLFNHRTVFGNLLLAGKLAGMTKEVASEKAVSLLDRFGLAHKHNSYAAEISGGQRQRVAIAQQLMAQRQFILMDEPFSGLDPVMRDEACSMIGEIAATDELLTFIVVTHDITAAVEVADTILLIGRDEVDGKKVAGARVQKVINLAERGLAWNPNITSMPAFNTTVAELRETFNHL